MSQKYIWFEIVSKAKPGSYPREIKTVEPHERESLIRMFTEHGGNPTGVDRALAKKTLFNLVIYDGWLACSCLSKNDYDVDYLKAPILYSVKIPGKNNDGVTLRRAAFRPSHHKDCEFFKADDKNNNATTESGCQGFKTDGKRNLNADELLTILKPIDLVMSPLDLESDKEEDIIDIGNVRGRSKRPSKLSRILLTLMDYANLTSIDHTEDIAPRYKQLAAIQAVLANQYFDAGNKLCVQKFTEVNLENTKRLCATIKSKSADWKQNNTVPQGFLIGLAKSFEGKFITTLNNVEVEIDTPVGFSGQNTKGPYLVIILVGRRNGGSWFTPIRAFTQPVFSENLLVPVESDYERKTLKILLDCQIEKKFSITKPVADRLVSPNLRNKKPISGEPAEIMQPMNIRPDFILCYDQGKTVVVETMGYQTIEYIERKKRTHPYMRVLGEIIEHRPDVDSDEMFRKLL